jgi:hypothetical protein
MVLEVLLQLLPLMFSVRHDSSLTLAGGDEGYANKSGIERGKSVCFQTVCCQLRTPTNHRLIITMLQVS